MGELILAMLNAATVTHILHLKSRSYASHMALGEFYAGIADIADHLAEAYMGSTLKPIEWKATTFQLGSDASAVIGKLSGELRSARVDMTSELQNIADEAIALCDSTLYKLKFLA